MTGNISRLRQELDELARISSHTFPAVTRVVFSEEDLRARKWLVEKCEAAGLTVRFDAVGNLFARAEGTDASQPALATGSHTDAIPNAGMFDGVVGVLGGLEAIRMIQESGVRLRHPLELIMFTSEEPTLFGIGCLGSRLMSGSLEPQRADSLKDLDGRSLAEWRAGAGYTGDLAGVETPVGTYAAFVELHIEQGPILEREGFAIGIVEKIAAPAALRIEFTGEGGHAGAVLMPDRHDAVLAAAELALELEKLVLNSGSPDCVGTTGMVKIHPNAINSIPCRALVEMDIRDTRLASRDAVVEGVVKSARAVAARRGLELEVDRISVDPPAICDERLLEILDQSSGELKSRRLVSRAYHDSLFMSRIVPTAMIFIPCKNGWSHRPDEFSSPEQIARGVEVLARALVAADSVF
ncbi:MAG: M20 family metallo-hydrolase [Terrimicrobiaceae bacterium]